MTARDERRRAEARERTRQHEQHRIEVRAERDAGREPIYKGDQMNAPTDLFDPNPVPLHVQLDTAMREVRLRRRVYPRLVEQGKMTAFKMKIEIEAMEGIVRTLRGLLSGS